MKLHVLTADDIEAALPMPEAITAMAQAFEAFSSGTADIPQRQSLAVADRGTFLVKPGVVPGTALGAKLATVFPANAGAGHPTTSALMVLLDPTTGVPSALLDGTFLTSWRTGAAAGLANDLLARRDATTAAILGAGGQAPTQALALAAVRELEEVRIWGPTPERVEAVLTSLDGRLSARLVAAKSAEAAVREADVVCTATPATDPVLDHTWLAPGTHVNAIGSFTPAMRELDDATVAAARIIVDSRQACATEAGELVRSAAAGADPADWSELGEIVAGTAPARQSPEELTVFKSVGLAVQDLIASARILDGARQRGLGSTLEL